MRNPDYALKTFDYVAGFLQEYAPWDLDLSRTDSNDLKDTVARTAVFLKDIGLSPDRKYTVAEIVRLQTAIEQALGGGR